MFMTIKEKLSNLTKKQKQQIIVGSSVVLLLVAGGVTAGTIANNNAVKAAHDKQVQQEAKKKSDEKIKAENDAEIAATTALATADKVDTDQNIKAAVDAIAKVKDTAKSKTFTTQLNVIKARQALENKAKAAVTTYQKDATNNTKFKAAQDAVNKLTAPQSKVLKEQLNKKISDSKAQVNKAKAAADAAKKAETEKAAALSKSETIPKQSTETSSTLEPSTSVEGNSDYVPAAGNDTNNYTPPVDNGGGNTAPSNLTPSNPNPSTPAPPTGGNSGGNNGGGTTTPPPATTYTGWVRNKEGQIVWQQGGFPTSDAAYAAAANWLNANATSGGWSCGSN
jgi:peptidoglycan DL-endopeptidase CwlO